MSQQAVIEQKVSSKEPLTCADGLYLLTQAPFLWLGRLAHQIRLEKNPPGVVTFVVDANPNYTNICDTDCHFCAFFRRPKDADAYALSVPEVMRKIERAAQQGATTILLQGGHNRALRLDYYLDLVRETRRQFPTVTPHFFTASEIQTMAAVEGLSVEDVLARLWEAGQRTLPGGGAEILSERVRRLVSPKKGGPEAWLQVHAAAHALGFKSTATMMYGHLEEPADVLTHLESLRSLQEKSLAAGTGGGFTAFIPWSFKPDNTVLERRFSRRTGAIPYLRMLATARLFLHNLDHIQASWFSEGKKAGQVALHFGADDFGGTLFEENVHAEAGFVEVSTVPDVIHLIHSAGFDAAQRTTTYERLAHFPQSAPIAWAPDTTTPSLRRNQPILY